MIAVKRVHRQHASLVVTVPVALCREMAIEAGTHLIFEWYATGGKFSVRILQEGEKLDVGSDESGDGTNPGG